jgi:hypothetical protein
MQILRPTHWKQRLTHWTTFALIAASAAIGLGLHFVLKRVSGDADQVITRKRYQASLDLSQMYGLQVSYKRAKGTYANDLASLLSVDPDAAALKASLAANVDMNTLAVVGDANKFKIELNVLDPDRTPIKIRGPIPAKTAAPEPSALPAPAPPSNGDGAPIAPAPGR